MTQPAVQRAIDGGLITTGTHLCTWPTGTGKTHWSLQAARHTLTQGEKVIVLVPLRALAQEVCANWTASLNARVEAYTSDTRRAAPYRTQDVLIMTPERLDLVTRNWRRHHHWLAHVGLIVVDELHLLSDPHRGARMDGALTRLRAVCPLVRLIALSATVGDPQSAARWLGAHHWDGATRPVPLHWQVHEVKQARQKIDRVASLLRRGTLVFVGSRTRAQEYAQSLSGDGYEVAAHHAGLSTEARRDIETRFRAGTLHALISTGTLELGVNLPCTSVIIADLTRFDASTGRRTPVSTVTLWQRGGRAGRTPDATRGDVHLLALPGERETAHTALTGTFEPLRSPLGQDNHLMDFILGSVDAGMARTARQLTRLVGRTFAASTGTIDPAASVQALTEQGGLDLTGDHLKVTRLGRVASQALLPLSAVRGALELDGEETPFDLNILLLRAAAQGMDLPVPRTMPDGPEAWLHERLTAHQIATVPSRLLERTRVPFAECRAAALLREACNLGDEDAARNADVDVMTVTALREGCARLAQAWHALRPDLRRLKLHAASLATGVPYALASLTLIPGIGRALSLRLAVAGVSDIENLAARVSLTVPGVRPERVGQWIEQAERLVKTFRRDVTWEGPARHAEDTDGTLRQWPAELCPGRLRRAVWLTVSWQDGHAEVTGGAATHHTTLTECDCPDHRAARPCKHRLAALLSQGDPEVTTCARELLADEWFLTRWAQAG